MKYSARDINEMIHETVNDSLKNVKVQADVSPDGELDHYVRLGELELTALVHLIERKEIGTVDESIRTWLTEVHMNNICDNEQDITITAYMIE